MAGRPMFRNEMMTASMVQVRHDSEWHLWVFPILWDPTKRQTYIPQSASIVSNDRAAYDQSKFFVDAHAFAASEAKAAGLIP